MVAEEDSSLLHHDLTARLNSGFSLAGSSMEDDDVAPLAVMVTDLVARFASEPVRERMAGRWSEGGGDAGEERSGEGRGESGNGSHHGTAVSEVHPSRSPAAGLSSPPPPLASTIPSGTPPISPGITAVLSALDESSAAAAASAAVARSNSSTPTGDGYCWVRGLLSEQ